MGVSANTGVGRAAHEDKNAACVHVCVRLCCEIGWDFCACGWESEWVSGWTYLCSSALVCCVLCAYKCIDAFCSVPVCTTEHYSPFVPRSIYNTFRSKHCCVLCVETCAGECACPVSCVTTVLHYSSEVNIVVIVVSVIVSAIGIAGLAAGIATVSCCVYMMWRKKTTASVGGTQDHGESLLVLIK